MRAGVAIALAAFATTVFAACSGTTGVRDRSEALVVETHCRDHACAATPPTARGLGEGCYVVDDRQLYQCSTDELPAGQASCFEVKLCTGACEVTVTDGRFREISTDRCRALFSQDRAARRPPPACEPAQLQVVVSPDPGSAASSPPVPSPSRPRQPLPLPPALVIEVMRSGKDRVVYETRVCGTAGGATVGESPDRATGFAELDHVLRAKAAEVAPPQGACVIATLVASHFECEVEQALL